VKHLLLTRFQGALIGASTIYLTDRQIAPNQLAMSMRATQINGLNCLVARGKFEPQDWPQIYNGNDPERAILAMLPLMLFFHEDRGRLRQTILEVSHLWQLDWETSSCAMAIGYIISRCLTESFDENAIVSQLLDEAINLHPSLFQELNTLDRLQERPHSLQREIYRVTTITHPIIAATVLAIYCLLSTPEDFLLANRRAYNSADRPEFICVLTGILAGARDSLTGIPLHGLMAIPDRANLLVTASNLLDVWAGVDLAGTRLALPTSAQPVAALPLPIAAARVIQRR
jgi:hypothetical protein